MYGQICVFLHKSKFSNFLSGQYFCRMTVSININIKYQEDIIKLYLLKRNVIAFKKLVTLSGYVSGNMYEKSPFA